MGRGRKGIIDQSTKKPKINKDKIRGPDWGLISSHYKHKKYPLLLSEDVIAEMKQMNPKKLMDILLPNNVNRDISSQRVENKVSVSNKFQLTEAIKILPLELRERIYKEFIKIKLRERKALGWDEVNAAIAEAPFCYHNEQIVKVLFCYKCGHCRRNGICNLCKRNGVNHYLGYPIHDQDDYDECFKKSWYNSWCGAVA